MHVNVETAARTFEIFNVASWFSVSGIPLVRIMPKLLRKRSEKIRADIEAARKTTEDANTRLSAVEAKLASLNQEIARFRTEVEQQIVQDEQHAKAALGGRKRADCGVGGAGNRRGGSTGKALAAALRGRPGD